MIYDPDGATVVTILVIIIVIIAICLALWGRE